MGTLRPEEVPLGNALPPYKTTTLQTMLNDSRPPTLRSELRRGFNAYNLSVSAGTAAVVGLALYALTSSGAIPDHLGRAPWVAAAIGALATFLSIAVFHAAIHAYFGWRFQRGMQALARSELRKAEKFLKVYEWPGMDHYDPDGHARAALLKCRSG